MTETSYLGGSSKTSRKSQVGIDFALLRYLESEKELHIFLFRSFFGSSRGYESVTKVAFLESSFFFSLESHLPKHIKNLPGCCFFTTLESCQSILSFHLSIETKTKWKSDRPGAATPRIPDGSSGVTCCRSATARTPRRLSNSRPSQRPRWR